jgi:hypothetical protein
MLLINNLLIIYYKINSIKKQICNKIIFKKWLEYVRISEKWLLNYYKMFKKNIFFNQNLSLN